MTNLTNPSRNGWWRELCDERSIRCAFLQHTLETALLSASQEIELGPENPATLQSVIQQRDLLQSGLLSTCRELTRVTSVSTALHACAYLCQHLHPLTVCRVLKAKCIWNVSKLFVKKLKISEFGFLGCTWLLKFKCFSIWVFFWRSFKEMILSDLNKCSI